MIKNFVLVVRDHHEIDYKLSAGLDRLFEQGIYEHSVARLVDTDHVPVVGCQSLVGFFGPKGFLS